MIAREFMLRLQGAYGKYNPVMFDDVKNWLTRTKPDLEKLYQAIIEIHEYSTPPNVAVLAKAWAPYRNMIPEYKALPEPDDSGEWVKINWNEIWQEYKDAKEMQ